MSLLIIIVIAYLLGSIPFGYILVRIFRGADVRTSGSGNIGATNVARTSPVLGLATLALDGLKGYLAVAIASSLLIGKNAATIAALFAVIGHMYPFWLKFYGGKGVATGLGAFLMVAPKAVLAMVGIFVAIVVVFRYVSLGSIVAVAFFPLLAWLLYRPTIDGVGLTCMTVTAVLIIARHHENIRRLIAGAENRLNARRG